MRGERKRKMAERNPHYVYWGSHGCKKHNDHIGICVCACGERLTRDWTAYGEHFASAHFVEDNRPAFSQLLRP